MKLFLTSVLTLLSITFTFAQLEKTIHQTFEAGEATEINLDLYGAFEIEFWAGNNILTETKIELHNASPSILNHFIEKEKRYEIEADTAGTTLSLYSHDKKRETIRTRTGECFEIARLKVFIPEKYFLESPAKLVLRG